MLSRKNHSITKCCKTQNWRREDMC